MEGGILARPHTSQPIPISHSPHISLSRIAPPMSAHQGYQPPYSTYSHTTTTQAPSTATLFGQPLQQLPQPPQTPQTPPPAFPRTPVNGGPVEASDNVLNKRADKDTSLFQRCLTLPMRLRAIPGFEHWMAEEEDKADDDADPVTLLWRTFRRGYPLMELYNALGPPVLLSIPNAKTDEKSMKKNERLATYKFIQACVNELSIPQESCFILGDLYGDDTTGFVKVGALQAV